VTGIVVIISFFIAFFLYICVPWICGRCCRGIIRIKAVRSGVLVLTFDDGPSTWLTPAILDLLAEYNVKASFFLLGRNIPGRESVVRQIYAQGHDICSHGHDHLNYWNVSPLRAVADIKHGWQAIDTALDTNRGTYPFRPPYGRLNLVCLVYLLLHRVPIVYWTVDTGDTWPPSSRDKNRAASLIKKTCGAVTLAHDFDRKREDTSKMILEVTGSLLEQAKIKGMRVVTVSELLKNKKKIYQPRVVE